SARVAIIRIAPPSGSGPGQTAVTRRTHRAAIHPGDHVPRSQPVLGDDAGRVDGGLRGCHPRRAPDSRSLKPRSLTESTTSVGRRRGRGEVGVDRPTAWLAKRLPTVVVTRKAESQSSQLKCVKWQRDG